MSRKLLGLIGLAILIVGAFLFFRYGAGAAALWSLSDSGRWLLPLVAVSALLDSINPCAFSVLLLTVAFLFSIGKSRGELLKIGGVYVAGIFVAYMLIGLGILSALHLFNTPHFMAKVGAGLLVLLGLIGLVSGLFPSFPIKLGIPHGVHKKIAALMVKITLPTAFVLGALVGLCEFPCTGGPYLMVLGLLHDRDTYGSGLGYLLLYNLIFILPLVVLLAIASDANVVGRLRAWQQKERGVMKIVGGAAMIVLGLLIYFI